MSSSSRLRALLGAALLLTAAGLSTPAIADYTAPDALDKVRERGALTIAVYADYPPYSYEQAGKIVGLDVDIATALARALGVSASVRAVVAGEDGDDDLRNYVWKGTVVGGAPSDLMMHVGADPQYVRRQDHVAIFGVYLHDSVALGLRPSRIPNYVSLEQLKGRKTAVEQGSLSDIYLRDAYGGILRDSVLRLPTATAAVQAFIDDKADAVMTSRGELLGLVKMLGGAAIEPKTVQFTGLYRNQWDIGMAVKSDAARLRAALTVALSKLESDGGLAAIYARYGLDYTALQAADAKP